MSTELMIILSMLAPALLVVVLATGLYWVGKRLEIISEGLGQLGGALATVESQHLRPLFGLVHKVNPPLNAPATCEEILKAVAAVESAAGA